MISTFLINPEYGSDYIHMAVHWHLDHSDYIHMALHAVQVDYIRVQVAVHLIHTIDDI